MAANQPQWPREWLMTDERIGDRLWEAIAALPEGSGIVFRYYATPNEQRIALARQVAELCKDGGLVLSIARSVELARQLGAVLVHNPAGDPGNMPFSRSAHSMEEAQHACAAGAALLFVAPVFATRSHPGKPPLGAGEAVRIAQACPIAAIALGGVDRGSFAGLRRGGFYGWAGIDAWLPDPVR